MLLLVLLKVLKCVNSFTLQTLWNRCYYYHFIGEETKAQKNWEPFPYKVSLNSSIVKCGQCLLLYCSWNLLYCRSTKLSWWQRQNFNLGCLVPETVLLNLCASLWCVLVYCWIYAVLWLVTLFMFYLCLYLSFCVLLCCSGNLGFGVIGSQLIFTKGK